MRLKLAANSPYIKLLNAATCGHSRSAVSDVSGLEQQKVHRTRGQLAGTDGGRELRVGRRPGNLVVEPGFQVRRTQPWIVREVAGSGGRVIRWHRQAGEHGQQRQRRGLPRGLLAAAAARLALDARAVPLQARRGREPAVRRRLRHLHGGHAQPLGLAADDGDRRAGVYRFKTRRRYAELRFGLASRLRQDRGPCLSVCCI